MSNKEIKVPCEKYFLDRLLFFIDGFFFADGRSKYTDNEKKLLEASICKARAEYGLYNEAIEKMRNDGATVIIEDIIFKPLEFIQQVENMARVVEETPSPESNSNSDMSDCEN